MASTAHDGYGSFQTLESGLAEPPQWKRKSINLYAAFIAFIIPFAIFCTIFAATSLLPFYYPWTNEVIIGIDAAFIICIFFYAVDGCYGEARVGKPKGNNHPFWFSYNVLFSSLALITGYFLARYNYDLNLLPYFVMSGLHSYGTVDPLMTKGQMVMDGGIFNFTEDSVLDIPHAMAFRGADDVYCVAPISVTGPNATSPPAALPSYDFWAVGTNCCNGNGNQGQIFRCGEWDVTDARGGLRVLKDDQTPYFRLAVQQAEAAYNIKAVSPVFLYWMADPKGEIDAYLNDGIAFLVNGITIAGIAFFSLTALVVLVLAKFAD